MLPIDAWPLEILTPKHPGFWPSGGVRRGPDSISQLQLLDNLAGGPLWRARYTDIPLYCRDRVLAAQAIQGLALQGVGLFRVWRSLGVRRPVAPGEPVPFSDGSSFSDGTLFAGVAMSAALVSAAEVYAAEVEISVDGATVQAGMEFSAYDPDGGWRLHRINRVAEDSAPGIYGLEINPPLRFDLGAGAELDFETPSCTMRMTNAESFLQLLEWNEYADVTAEFEEAML